MPGNRMTESERHELIGVIPSLRKEWEGRMAPLEELNPKRPATFISVGGGELGDLAITAAKRNYGGMGGGIKAVAFDKYQGFPAQDAAEESECFNMMDGDLLEKRIRKHVPDPSEPHAIYLEVERIDTYRAYRMGMEKGYRIMSTPFSPLVCMDRHATKIMFDKLNLEMTGWRYASSAKEVEATAREFGLPVIVKPVMTSSGHGTSIVKTKDELAKCYAHAVEHARGIGNEVIVEEYLPELKSGGTEITQIVVRHFDNRGRIVNSTLPPIEHKRPGATYHESWLPSTISEGAERLCKDGAVKIAEFMGGLGIYAVEQFVIGDKVFNNEVANRPHDTGLVTRWMLNMDEGALQLTSTLGMEISQSSIRIARSAVFGVAHVVLAPEKIAGEVEVGGWDASKLNSSMPVGAPGDVWYFGKPTAYAGRRMGLAVAFEKSLDAARRQAESIAHLAEGCIRYRGGE